MDTSIVAQIAALRRMSTSELQGEWLRLNGEPARSSNKQFLFRRLAWKVQEARHGGLSVRAKSRLEELADDVPDLARTPAQARQVADPAPGKMPRRDPRLPSPGTVLTRQYRGQEIRVSVHETGFEWDGQVFASLSAVARAVTGSKWNGKLFFGLTERKRKV